ncbi:MAG: aconitate hydratase [Thermoplasmata archaeon HGW-Thermoplasmata-1]|nr:MAG: aconitate hydratase [Thermoplasmata archaeon HGW-Thermoplasmata-1]
MVKNIVEKILLAHIVEGEPAKGSEVGMRIDQTLTQDATGTMAYLQFEAMRIPRVKTDLSVSYVDHNTVQVGFENADDHNYLQTVAAKHGIKFSRPGNGICHQVHLERFGKPGTTLIGSDSHTTTGGGVGQIAIGAGGLDVAVAMGGGAFYITYPNVIKVNLTGELKPWVGAKDVILKVLEHLTTKGNVGCMLEYAGPGVASLTVPERATITNMGAETGVTTSVFPSDEETKKFLKAQGREGDWIELKADEGAEYDRVIDIDLSALEPLAAMPHSPGNIKKVCELEAEGMDVDQVAIGSCTNSSYVDLMTVAKILKGHVVATSVGIAPGSKQVLQMIAGNGALSDLIASGTRILESACGFCIGNHFSPSSKGVSLRTNNRNFEGRSGTKDAQVYLVSPETAAAAAITGKFTDPRKLEGMGIKHPKVEMPNKFLIDDSMILDPVSEKEASKITVFRGPNIGNPPVNDPMPDAIEGEVVIKVEDKITTDHIMPAGSRLKYRSNIEKYASFVFEPLDTTFPDRCKANKQKGIHNIIVAGLSYGQGSSREHAAMCPMYLGVKAVIAKSIERIHMANLVNFGILPIFFENEADYDGIAQGDVLEIPDAKKIIAKGGEIYVENKTRGKRYRMKYDLSERQKEIIFAGGMLAYTVKSG